MRYLRLFSATLACTSLLVACQNSADFVSPTPTQKNTAFTAQKKALPDRYLCTVESKGNENATIKMMDLQSHQVRAVFVPGRVSGFYGSRENQRLYISSSQGTQSPQHALYEADVNQGTIRRILSFSQAGITPTDFVVDEDRIYVAGQQNNKGVLFGYSLKQSGWQPVVYDIQPGSLEWGTNHQALQVLNFGEEDLTRTTIDIPNRKVLSVFTFNHGVPFGNNVGVSTDDGMFYYAVHQLKENMQVFAYNTQTGAQSTLLNPERQKGILYSSVITKNGRYLYASVNDKIERYELKGTQVQRLPSIDLKFAEARYLALSNSDQVLYVSHDKSNRVSRISFHPDQVTYDLSEVAFPGENNELVVF